MDKPYRGSTDDLARLSATELFVDRVTRGTGAKISGYEIKIIRAIGRFAIPEKQGIDCIFADDLAFGTIVATPILQTGEVLFAPDCLGDDLRSYGVRHRLIPLRSTERRQLLLAA